MADLLWLIFAVLASLFKFRAELGAEDLVLRQQVNVLDRRMPRRPALTNVDRLLFVWLYHWFPATADALAIVRPETVIRWHRVGFWAFWRWRSRGRVGRPKVSLELRALIAEMSRANPRGALRVFTVNCSSLGSTSPSRPSPSTWSGDAGRRRKAGIPFCAITPRTSVASTCWSCRRSVSGCSPAW
jgi:hypothetical protein